MALHSSDEYGWKSMEKTVLHHVQHYLCINRFNRFVFEYCILFYNISIDLEESLYALFQISAFSGLTYMCIVAFLLRNEITVFLGTLSQIYDARKKLYISDNFFSEKKSLLNVISIEFRCKQRFNPVFDESQ